MDTGMHPGKMIFLIPRLTRPHAKLRSLGKS